MAGNNSIQFVRGTSSQRAAHTETSLVGQPIYETDTNKLYVGDGETSVNDLTAVKASSADEAETADNVVEQINGNAISSIFEPDGTTVKEATHADSATNVTERINGKAITSIFESDGRTVKEATIADSYICRQYTGASGWMQLSTVEHTLVLRSSDFKFHKLEIYYSDTTDPSDAVHRLLVSMLKPPTLTYSFSVPIVINSKVSTVTISNTNKGANEITFKLAEDSETPIYITQVLGIRIKYKAHNE